MSPIVVQFPGAAFGAGEGVAGIRAERARLEEEALRNQQVTPQQQVIQLPSDTSSDGQPRM